MITLKDNFFRVIDYLRLSVTDRCNLRCIYCMPAEGVLPFDHSDILGYEEIIRVVKIAGGARSTGRSASPGVNPSPERIYRS